MHGRRHAKLVKSQARSEALALSRRVAHSLPVNEDLDHLGLREVSRAQLEIELANKHARREMVVLCDMTRLCRRSMTAPDRARDINERIAPA